ncbi:MAG TPA: ABC transporter ATP-binding protein [Symbiobacteriaceae bacterium]|nr:ABC transporter ATP-binding protein [Symbiobacteriaceae bacterium]
MTQPMIELNRVSKRFGEHPVLREFSMTVGRGEIVGLLGPNGSGKTTSIRLMNGVMKPDGGAITMAGYDPVHDGEPIRRMSGMMTESAGFYLNMTGLQNLQLFADLYGVTDSHRPLELLEEFGLAGARDQKVGTYSTGMKKRLGLAKALLHRPEILFLDEPTNGLDPEGIRMVLAHIVELNRRHGTTMILCSHLLQQLETVCHRYVFITGGRVIEQGTLAELEERHVKEAVLQVETDLALQGGSYRGMAARRTDDGHVEFTLPGKAAVPEFLRALTREANVYGATLVNQDLESLYFKIREVARHE